MFYVISDSETIRRIPFDQISSIWYSYQSKSETDVKQYLERVIQTSVLQGFISLEKKIVLIS